MFRVLIVDDEPLLLAGIGNLIDWNAYGFYIQDTASNGKEAFKLHKKNRYDLIITDLKMPIMGGLDLIQKIDEEDLNCKIIIVSAYGEFSYAQKAMQYGVRYYLLKPISETVLCGFLSKVYEELSSTSEIQEESIDRKCFERQCNMSQNGVIVEIQQYINCHYPEKLSLNLLGNIYGFSPVYLGRVFKKETGINFNEYLNQCRIQAAQRYMLQYRFPISEICEMVGYRDLNYFYKCFKKYVGCSPKAYLEKNTDIGEEAEFDA